MVVRFAFPDGPDDASEFVGKRDSGFVIAASLLKVECPRAKSVGLGRLAGGPEDGASAMSQEGSKVDVTLFADASEAAGRTGGAFARGKTQVAGEMSAGTESVYVADESDERGGGENSDAGDGEEAFDDGRVFGQGAKLLLGVVHERLEEVDLLTGLAESIPEWHGNWGVGVFD